MLFDFHSTETGGKKRMLISIDFFVSLRNERCHLNNKTERQKVHRSGLGFIQIFLSLKLFQSSLILLSTKYVYSNDIIDYFQTIALSLSPIPLSLSVCVTMSTTNATAIKIIVENYCQLMFLMRYFRLLISFQVIFSFSLPLTICIL